MIRRATAQDVSHELQPTRREVNRQNAKDFETVRIGVVFS